MNSWEHKSSPELAKLLRELQLLTSTNPELSEDFRLTGELVS